MDLRNQQIKETYGNLATINTVAGTPTTGVLQNGAGSNVTTLTIAGTLDATTLGGTLSTAAQTNITSVGTLTGLSVSGTTGLDGAVTINNSKANVDFRVAGDNEDNLLFVDASADQIGVGTNSTDGLLSVGNNATTGSLVSLNSAVGGSIRIKKAGTNTGFIGDTESALGSGDGMILYTYSGATRPILFYTEGTEKMRIDSSGNVGIGVTPSFKLDVRSTSVPAIRISRSGAAGSNAATGITFEAREPTVGTGETSAIYGISGNLVFRTGGTSGDSTGGSEIARFTTDGLTFNGDTAAANALDDYEEGTFTPTVYGASTAGTTTYTVQNGYYTKIGRQVTVYGIVSYSAMTGTGSMLIGGLPVAITIGNLTNGYPVGSCFTDGMNWGGGTTMTIMGTINDTTMTLIYSGDNISASTQQCVNESAGFRFSLTYFTS